MKPKPPPVVHHHECVGASGHMGVCCCECAEWWDDPTHGSTVEGWAWNRTL